MGYLPYQLVSRISSINSYVSSPECSLGHRDVVFTQPGQLLQLWGVLADRYK